MRRARGCAEKPPEEAKFVSHGFALGYSAAASSEGAAAIAVAPTYATTGRETGAGVVADAMILDAIFGTGPVDSAKGVVV